MSSEQTQPGIRISQVYLEHAHFQHRDGYLSLPHTTPHNVGQLQVQFEVGMSPDEEKALVRVRVATEPESESLYLFDVCMVALLRRDREHPNMPLAKYVGIAGGTLLYPFIREAVANLTTRGRFGPVWLAPFNIQAVLEGEPAKKKADPIHGTAKEVISTGGRIKRVTKKSTK